MSKKLTKEEVRGPDAFIAFTDRIIEGMEKNKKTILTVVVAAFTVGVAFLIYGQVQESKISKLQTELYTIEAQQKEITERLEEKENHEYTDLNADYGDVVTKYESFINGNLGSAASQMAALSYVDLLLKYNEFEKANSVLESTIAKSNGKGLFYGLVSLQKAFVELNLKQYQEAINRLEKIADDESQSHLHAQALLRAGLAYNEMGESDRAIELLERVGSEFDRSSASNRAKGFLKYLKFTGKEAKAGE